MPLTAEEFAEFAAFVRPPNQWLIRNPSSSEDLFAKTVANSPGSHAVMPSG
jgi:hypothetical protein